MLDVWNLKILVLINFVASELVLNDNKPFDILGVGTKSIEKIKSISPLNNPLLGFAVNTIAPKFLRDLPKYLTTRPPVKLKRPRNVTHGTPEDVRRNIIRSFVSMCPAEKILNFQCLCSNVISNVKVLENKGLNALVTVGAHNKDKLIIVSYRAIMNAQNFLNSVQYPLVDLASAKKGVKVHSGFLSNYLATYFDVKEAVASLLDNPKYRKFKLSITGYSLGAAVATISIPDWVNLLRSRGDNRPIEVYAYSSPRPGNEAFAQYLESLNILMTRYSNKNDVVPHLPPRVFGFTHVLPEIHERKVGFGKTELVVCSQEYDEDPKCGYRESLPVSIAQHFLPLNGLPPLPPYCQLSSGQIFDLCFFRN